MKQTQLSIPATIPLLSLLTFASQHNCHVRKSSDGLVLEPKDNSVKPLEVATA